METVQPVYFCFGAKPANSQFATKTAKKKICEYCHSSERNYQKKLKRLKFFTFQRWLKKTIVLPRVLLYTEDLETFDVETETGITEYHIINNLLTELGRTATTSGQYSPVRPSRPVSKRLVLFL